MPFFKKKCMCHVEKRHLPLWLILSVLMLFSPALSNRTEAASTNETFKEGIAALDVGNSSSAETAFLSVLEAVPKHAGALYHLGFIALKKGRLNQALNYLNQAARIDRHLLPVFLRMAEAHEQQGNLEEAVRALDTASRRVKDSADPVAKTIEEGIDRLKNRIKIQAQIRQGIRLLRSGKHLEAKVIFQEVLVTETENAELHHFVAVALGIEGKFEEAIQSFKTALRLKPDLTEARTRLVDLYLATAQLKRARDAIESAIFFLEDPDGLEAQTLALRLDSLEDQIVDKRLMDKAMKEVADKKNEAAALTLKNLIRIRPNHQIAYFNLGILAAQEKKFDQAIPFFEKIITINPKHREAHERLAQIYELNRFFSRAIKHYETALSTLGLRISSESKALKTMIARANAGKKQSSLAANEALQQGNTFLEQGEINLAAQAYEQASFIKREDAEIRFQLGLLYERLERPDLANAAMRATIELAPEHLPAQRYLAKRDEDSGFLYQALKRWQKIHKSEAVHQKDIFRVENKIRAVELTTASLTTQAMQLAESDMTLAAIKTLETARALAPDDPRIRTALSTLYLKADLSVKAFKALRTAQIFEPEQASHYLELARLYKSADQWTDAELNFNKALEAEFSSERIKKASAKGLALAIRKQTDIKVADRYLKRARRYHEKQDYQVAILWYEKIFRLFPTHTGALYWAGTAYESLIDYPSAKVLYEKILSINPNDALSHQRLGFIYEMDGRIDLAIKHYRANLVLWKGRENNDTTWVKGRLKPLEKNLNVSLNQTLLSYDSNPARSASSSPQLRSSAGFNLTYLLKNNRKLQIPIGFSSDSIFFFESNTLFSQQSLSISANGAKRPFSYSARYNFQFGIARGGPTGFDHVASFNLSWYAQAYYSSSLDLSMNSFVSPTNKDFNATRSNLRLSFRKDQQGSRSSLWYSYSGNQAKLNDQASTSHGLGISYSWPLTQKLSAAFSYDVTSTGFNNIDSLGGKRRENLSQSISLQSSYQLEEGVTLSLSVMENRNSSNLSSGAITIEQQLSGQAASLGDYSQRLIRASIYWTF